MALCNNQHRIFRLANAAYGLYFRLPFALKLACGFAKSHFPEYTSRRGGSSNTWGMKSARTYVFELGRDEQDAKRMRADRPQLMHIWREEKACPQKKQCSFLECPYRHKNDQKRDERFPVSLSLSLFPSHPISITNEFVNNLLD